MAGVPGVDAIEGACYGVGGMEERVETSDGDLARAVAAARTGAATDEAEAALYRRFAPRIRLYGLRHLRDEEAARDLVQQVMLLTIEKLRCDAVRDPDQIASFVLGVSRMTALDLKRRERRRAKLRDTFIEPLVCDPDEGLVFDLDRLEACVNRLGARERAVVLLTFYAERSARQVGEELAITEGHVRVLRHRAIGKLRACMHGGVQ